MTLQSEKGGAIAIIRAAALLIHGVVAHSFLGGRLYVKESLHTHMRRTVNDYS